MAKRSKALVCEHLENISRKALEQYQKNIREYVKGKQGVYALYKGDRLKYVGLARNLKVRLSAHLRDRHAQTWDKFSVYLTVDDEHLRELEALVIRIAAPKENRVKGKFSRSENLLSRFKSDIARQQRKERDQIFGISPKPPTKTETKRVATSAGKAPSPLDLKKRIAIKADYKGKTYKAALRKDGTVRFEGKVFTSPSRAGMAITKTVTLNGWKFWKYKNESGEWAYLDELRSRKKRPAKKTEKTKKASLAGRGLGPLKLRAVYKGETYNARIRKDGTIMFNGKLFTSPSYAAKEITGNPTSGPMFWKAQNRSGQWVKLKELIKDGAP